MIAEEILAEAERLHVSIEAEFKGNPKASTPTVVTIVSLHSETAGQWLIFNETYDNRAVAARLRLCATILEGGAI